MAHHRVICSSSELKDLSVPTPVFGTVDGKCRHVFVKTDFFT